MSTSTPKKWFLGAAAVLALGPIGCVGEAAVTYRGRVTEADTAGHVFEEAENGEAGAPIAGAAVRLIVSTSLIEDPCAFTVDPRARTHEIAITDDRGRFEVRDMFPGFIGTTNKIAICVKRDGYEPYVYRAVYDDTKDPRFGQKVMHVRLRKIGAAVAR
jgi:hypothetical protein